MKKDLLHLVLAGKASIEMTLGDGLLHLSNITSGRDVMLQERNSKEQN